MPQAITSAEIEYRSVFRPASGGLKHAKVLELLDQAKLPGDAVALKNLAQALDATVIAIPEPWSNKVFVFDGEDMREIQPSKASRTLTSATRRAKSIRECETTRSTFTRVANRE